MEELELLTAGHLGFHGARKARLKVGFAFASFEKDATLVNATLEAAHRVIDGFALTDNNFNGHFALTTFLLGAVVIYSFSKGVSTLF